MGDFAMKNIYFITGIAGFIDSHLAEDLLKNQDNLVVGIDNFFSGYQSNLDTIDTDNLIFYEGDIRDDGISTILI
jgi:UDP-glucose 4-epimerase